MKTVLKLIKEINAMPTLGPIVNNVPGLRDYNELLYLKKLVEPNLTEIESDLDDLFERIKKKHMF